MGAATSTVRQLAHIKKATSASPADSSAASFALAQRGDGSYVFNDVNGRQVRVHGLEATTAFKKLYDAIDALV